MINQSLHSKVVEPILSFSPSLVGKIKYMYCDTSNYQLLPFYIYVCVKWNLTANQNP